MAVRECACIRSSDNQATFLEGTVDRYWPATDSGASLELFSFDGTEPPEPAD